MYTPKAENGIRASMLRLAIFMVAAKLSISCCQSAAPATPSLSNALTSHDSQQVEAQENYSRKLTGHSLN